MSRHPAPAPANLRAPGSHRGIRRSLTIAVIAVTTGAIGVGLVPLSRSVPLVGSLPLPGRDAVALAACPNMQTLINNAPTGSTVTIPPCTYHQSVKIAKRLTVNATGAVIDGDNRRSVGLLIAASDVTVDGITVQDVRASDHDGAIYTNGVSRFTLKNATVRSSTPICLSLNGGTGHKILDSRLTRCGREGFFINAVSDTILARNTIDHNNPYFAFNWNVEAGGGKAMASRRITFDANTVSYNHGPGIWFDSGVVDATATNNKIHHNGLAGISFEISTRAEFSGNSIWENGWEQNNWAFGAGITISSSDEANVHDNTIAWNNRGISVISQNRHSPPHQNNVVHDNIVMSSTGDKVSGWYDDHGGSLFLSANGNRGYGDRFWVARPEPTSCRFEWKGCRTTLSSYNATLGEEGATYLSTSTRDSALAAAGIPPDDGTPPIGAPPLTVPRLALVTGVLGSSTLPGRGSWAGVPHARRYELQVQRDSGSWQALRLSSSTARSRGLSLAVGHRYRLRLRILYGGGILSRWAYTPRSLVYRTQETGSSIHYAGSWHRIRSDGASGGYVRYTTAPNATATFAFNGRSFIWVSPKGPTRGYARVYVDGTYRALVNLHTSSFSARRVVYRASWAKAGLHVVLIKNLATSGHPRIDVDAVGYLN